MVDAMNAARIHKANTTLQRAMNNYKNVQDECQAAYVAADKLVAATQAEIVTARMDYLKLHEGEQFEKVRQTRAELDKAVATHDRILIRAAKSRLEEADEDAEELVVRHLCGNMDETSRARFREVANQAMRAFTSFDRTVIANRERLDEAKAMVISAKRDLERVIIECDEGQQVDAEKLEQATKDKLAAKHLPRASRKVTDAVYNMVTAQLGHYANADTFENHYDSLAQLVTLAVDDTIARMW